jgi:hypothetical protein
MCNILINKALSTIFDNATLEDKEEHQTKLCQMLSGNLEIDPVLHKDFLEKLVEYNFSILGSEIEPVKKEFLNNKKKQPNYSSFQSISLADLSNPSKINNMNEISSIELKNLYNKSNIGNSNLKVNIKFENIFQKNLSKVYDLFKYDTTSTSNTNKKTSPSELFSLISKIPFSSYSILLVLTDPVWHLSLRSIFNVPVKIMKVLSKISTTSSDYLFNIILRRTFCKKFEGDNELFDNNLYELNNIIKNNKYNINPFIIIADETIITFFNNLKNNCLLNYNASETFEIIENQCSKYKEYLFINNNNSFITKNPSSSSNIKDTTLNNTSSLKIELGVDNYLDAFKTSYIKTLNKNHSNHLEDNRNYYNISDHLNILESEIKSFIPAIYLTISCLIKNIINENSELRKSEQLTSSRISSLSMQLSILILNILLDRSLVLDDKMLGDNEHCNIFNQNVLDINQDSILKIIQLFLSSYKILQCYEENEKNNNEIIFENDIIENEIDEDKENRKLESYNNKKNKILEIISKCIPMKDKNKNNTKKNEANSEPPKISDNSNEKLGFDQRLKFFFELFLNTENYLQKLITNINIINFNSSNHSSPIKRENLLSGQKIIVIEPRYLSLNDLMEILSNEDIKINYFLLTSFIQEYVKNEIFFTENNDGEVISDSCSKLNLDSLFIQVIELPKSNVFQLKSMIKKLESIIGTKTEPNFKEGYHGYLTLFNSDSIYFVTSLKYLRMIQSIMIPRLENSLLSSRNSKEYFDRFPMIFRNFIISDNFNNESSDYLLYSSISILNVQMLWIQFEKFKELYNILSFDKKDHSKNNLHQEKSLKQFKFIDYFNKKIGKNIIRFPNLITHSDSIKLYQTKIINSDVCDLLLPNNEFFPLYKTFPIILSNLGISIEVFSSSKKIMEELGINKNQNQDLGIEIDMTKYTTNDTIQSIFGDSYNLKNFNSSKLSSMNLYDSILSFFHLKEDHYIPSHLLVSIANYIGLDGRKLFLNIDQFINNGEKEQMLLNSCEKMENSFIPEDILDSLRTELFKVREDIDAILFFSNNKNEEQIPYTDLLKELIMTDSYYYVSTVYSENSKEILGTHHSLKKRVSTKIGQILQDDDDISNESNNNLSDIIITKTNTINGSEKNRNSTFKDSIIFDSSSKDLLSEKNRKSNRIPIHIILYLLCGVHTPWNEDSLEEDKKLINTIFCSMKTKFTQIKYDSMNLKSNNTTTTANNDNNKATNNKSSSNNLNYEDFLLKSQNTNEILEDQIDIMLKENRFIKTTDNPTEIFSTLHLQYFLRSISELTNEYFNKNKPIHQFTKTINLTTNLVKEYDENPKKFIKKLSFTKIPVYSTTDDKGNLVATYFEDSFFLIGNSPATNLDDNDSLNDFNKSHKELGQDDLNIASLQLFFKSQLLSKKNNEENNSKKVIHEIGISVSKCLEPIHQFDFSALNYEIDDNEEDDNNSNKYSRLINKTKELSDSNNNSSEEDF